MKFGSRVFVRRGGGGNLREVVGTLIGTIGNECIVRLEQDDEQDTVGWNKIGHVGRWSKSAVRIAQIKSDRT